MEVKGIEFKMMSPPRIYVNWEVDIICPLHPPFLHESELLDDILVGAFVDDFQEKDKPFNLSEILLYEDEMDTHCKPLKFERKSPVTFSLLSLEATSSAEGTVENHEALIKAVSRIQKRFMIRRHEREGNGSDSANPKRFEPVIKLVKRMVHGG
ncbi:hypothetical protein N431DRAFT_464558 [Stipitochalara longipes BDJ]|nr:hypothetical protein N431DRAFT_464558 [Stipitochalara longipes BDJ]